MKRIFLTLLAVCTVVGIAVAGVITRDGELVTTLREGSVTLDAGTFEAFTQPSYAAKHLTDGYKSYFFEVEAERIRPAIWPQFRPLQFFRLSPFYFDSRSHFNAMLFTQNTGKLFLSFFIYLFCP